MNISLIDCYAILGVPFGAPMTTVKTSYKRLANIYHPDKDSGDSELFDAIAKSYECIKRHEATLGMIVPASEADLAIGGVLMVDNDDTIILVDIQPNTKKYTPIKYDKVGIVTFV